jgi:hypothetical protein
MTTQTAAAYTVRRIVPGTSNRDNRTATFAQWMQAVDDRISVMAGGCTSDDLADYPYRDAYDDGVRAVTAARRAIKAQETGEF